MVEAPQENIFSLMVRKRTGNRELDDLMDKIWNARKTLPFSPRWFNQGYKEGRLMALLKELERRRLVQLLSRRSWRRPENPLPSSSTR